MCTYIMQMWSCTCSLEVLVSTLLLLLQWKCNELWIFISSSSSSSSICLHNINNVWNRGPPKNSVPTCPACLDGKPFLVPGLIRQGLVSESGHYKVQPTAPPASQCQKFKTVRNTNTSLPTQSVQIKFQGPFCINKHLYHHPNIYEDGQLGSCPRKCSVTFWMILIPPCNQNLETKSWRYCSYFNWMKSLLIVGMTHQQGVEFEHTRQRKKD